MGLGAGSELAPFGASALVETGWREPLSVAAAFAGEPFAVLLLSDGREAARWSYFARRPAARFLLESDSREDPWAVAAAMLGPQRAAGPGWPPFQGGVIGLAAYEFGARLEPTAPQARNPDWPDLAIGLYPTLLAFDHQERRVLAVGRGADQASADSRAAEALGWLQALAPAMSPGRVAERFAAVQPASAYEAAVAKVVEAIAAGEIFQANVARVWSGRLAMGKDPFDLLTRAAKISPAPFQAYFRLEGRAVVSNSPERFLSVSPPGLALSQPIKGTRPRGRDEGEDRRLAAELQGSAKDRAENLMIVDLMRNDFSRVCRPGTVRAPKLFALQSFGNVHHLVSSVEGRLSPGRTALDLMAAAFPPGSITGAPKVQAMRVIARFEPPRGPYCGSIFWVGFDGAMDSSVLIRTVALIEDQGGWRFEARAGAGLVADSDPAAERAETEDKLAALAAALEAEAP
jgi:para-aminobenzoate synthetase component 1